MIKKLKELFGMEPKKDISELIRNGAQIVDVRSRDEFRGGHVDGSINIPLQELNKNVSRIRKDKPVVVCCASGMRSASARSVLSNLGFEVYNGGGWVDVKRRKEN